MENIVIKTSVWKSVPALLVCLIFVLSGILMISTSNYWTRSLIGAASVIFFGAGFFILLWQTADRRPRITIDKNGITDRTLGVGRIDWADIEFAHLNSVFANSFIVLKLANTEKYLKNLSNASRKMTKLNKKLGFGELNLNLGLTDINPKKLHKIILAKILEDQYALPKTAQNIRG